MNNYPKSLQDIIDFFKLLPGVGEKTATRYAFSILNLDDDKINKISSSIKDIKSNIENCSNCGCLIEKGYCQYCDDNLRIKNTICVLENQKNVFIFEKNGYYKGKYHVLGGLISPIDGINPEDISISKLLSRIDKEKIDEVILALRPGIEGSTTALYIKKMLQDKKVKVSQIAQGVPMGAEMEYLDDLTLELALENRNELS